MLSGFLGIGFLAGLFLFMGKFFIYSMIMSIFPKGFKKWVYRTPAAMIIIDFGFAGLAAPVAGMAGGTIAMLTMITFGGLSATYIFIRLMISKAERKLKDMRSNFSRY